MPPKVKFWQKVDLENLWPKKLYNGMLTYKRPLIVIVAPQKLYSE